MISWNILILSFLFMYYDGMVVLIPSSERRDNLNRFYSSLYMTLIMAVFMAFIGNINWWLILGFIVVSIVVRKLIVTQYNVDDLDFAKGMIEHHEMALSMSKQLVNKNVGGPMTDLANSIIKSQTDEIIQMQKFLWEEYKLK